MTVPLTARWLPRIRLTSSSGPPPHGSPRLDLHVSRRARERFGLDSSLFSLAGGAVFADVAAARRLADRLATELSEVDRDLALAVTPARIYALGLVHELLHSMVEHYRREVDGGVLAEALAWIGDRLGPERVEATLLAFAREFPPLAVWTGEATLEDYLAAETGGRSHREILIEELVILWLANSSPAFAPFRELFDDGVLRRETAYPEVITALEEFLADRPAYPEAPTATSPPEERRSLFEALQAPAIEEPRSLSGQLRLLTREYAPPPPPGPQAARQLRAADLLREEERPVFPPGPGPVEVPEAEPEPEGPEQFSPDLDWMPRLVLMAKNTLVWLAQLSVAHGRPITRLDEIPESELELLARRGFTGLWLIGLWQRSAASRQIKQATGNPEAAASAYAVDSYTIAAELGGEEALDELRRQALKHGLRLACDMVPNHFGIDSEWVLEHPERFLQVPEPPFRAYTFGGPDLSPDPDVGIYLEDHYYDRTDAAVVFQRVDRVQEEIAYLYHGNDGTSTPWNDTAQLDYLQPEVREAVLETILDVARRFPVIRFDAAMTLARRHVRRLWYPPPGSGGDIPSRSEHGLSEEEFDRRMPVEFFREVVDRVALEAPDTLLLAEAFWLMETYFVRSLGMHRVYNSAFMILLRDERNADYRKAIKNVLAFEPGILQRYVNFMSNPDERTAIDQFGSGDKYFGAATLLATLPGLPMFGHGQIEGFVERYGMEYARAYRDERPDPWIVARHERQIVPLLERRRLFAGALSFVLFDFEKSLGVVDEDVFAYANRLGEERALVVFHNRPGTTSGRLRRSVPIAFKVEGAERPHLRWETLAHTLGLEEPDPEDRRPLLLSCRDAVTGFEHLFDPREIVSAGLLLALGGYGCHVFLDFEAIFEDLDGRWAALAAALAGRGVPSLAEALLEPTLEAVLGPFRTLIEPELVHRFLDAALSRAPAEPLVAVLAEVEEHLLAFLQALERHRESEGASEGATEALNSAEPANAEPPADSEGLAGLARAARLDLEAVVAWLASPASDLEEEEAPILAEGAPEAAEMQADFDPRAFLTAEPADGAVPALAVLYAWFLLRRLGEVPAIAGTVVSSRDLLDDLLLGKQLLASFQGLGAGEEPARDALLELKVLVAGLLPPLRVSAPAAWSAWFGEPDMRLALRLNRFEGWTYFHRESFERLLTWAAVEGPSSERIDEIRAAAQALSVAAAEASYRVESLVTEPDA